MPRMICTLLVLALTFVLADSVSGRTEKGFVSVLGVGVAAVSRFQSEAVSESGPAVVVDLTEGYSFDGQNVLCAKWLLSWRKSDYFTEEGRTVTHLDGSPLGDQSVRQNFMGASWYHYLRRTTRSVYMAVGVGFCDFSKSDFGKNERGLGWLVGTGYQFAEHFQAGTWMTVGKTTDGRLDFDHLQLGLQVSGLIY